MPNSWRESDFETWFNLNPRLPNEKNLLVLFHHPSPAQRMPDIIAIDEHCNIFLIEVKNEATGRGAIGQVIDYWSQYDKIDVTDLVEIYEGADLYSDFSHRFHKDLEKIGDRRFLTIVAPQFKPETIMMTRCFNENINKNVNLELLIADLKSNSPFDFDLSLFNTEFLSIKSFDSGSFVMSTSGKLLNVLKRGNNAVYWKMPPAKNYQMARGKVTKNYSKLVQSCAKPEWLDSDLQGRKFKNVAKNDMAILLGIVKIDDIAEHNIYYWIRIINGAKYLYQKRSWQQVKDNWQMLAEENEDLDWNSLVEKLGMHSDV